MSDQLFLGAVAVAIGLALGVLLFVPFVAVSYRRRGRLSVGRTLVWTGALIYFWAIWTYTLLPLPVPSEIVCVGAITDPMAMVRDVRTAFDTPGNPFRKPELLQLLFNVLLFIPLGFFVRLLGNRGVGSALVIGLGFSLGVELTQLTGVWGLYPCAYRFFDVGDLMTNTCGAVLGSLLGLMVPRERRGSARSEDAGRPRAVTRGRRAAAMICDGLGFWLVSGTISLVLELLRVFLVGSTRAELEPGIWAGAGTAGACAIWLATILITGSSVGDLCVRLRYTGSRLPEILARLLRWAGGIGGIAALGMLDGVFDVLAAALFMISCLLLFFTRAGRGLPGLLSGQSLRDAREPDRAGTPVPAVN